MNKFVLLIPVLLVFLLATVFILLLLGYYGWSFSVLIVTIFLNQYSETVPFYLQGKRFIEHDIRILTYNINRAHSFSVNNGTIEQLADFILRQEADIVLLQEYNVSLYPLLEIELRKVYPHCNNHDDDIRFRSVYSRYPIESCEQIVVKSEEPQFKLFQEEYYNNKPIGCKEVLPICKIIIRVGNQKIQVFNCHLMSNNFSVVIRRFIKDGINILSGFAEIFHRIDFGYKVRKLQAKLLYDAIQNEYATIICGDFNDVSCSPALKLYNRQGFVNAWWEKGFGFGFTYHGMCMRLRLDHVLYTPKRLKLTRVYIPHSNLSDHDPVICDFNLNGIEYETIS